MTQKPNNFGSYLATLPRTPCVEAITALYETASSVLMETPMGTSEFDKEHLSKHYEENKTSVDRRSKDNFVSSRYKTDENGIKWLYTKKRDPFTIYMAALDGMIQFESGHDELAQVYNSIKTPEDLKKAFQEAFKPYYEKCAEIYQVLKATMKGTTKVYRGLSFTKEAFQDIAQTKNDLVSSDALIKLIGNKTKKFNSFTTDKERAESMVEPGSTSFGKYYVILEGDAEPNDINYAFTAYQLGTYNGNNENEISINNIKNLKNLHIIEKHLPKMSELPDKWDNPKTIEGMGSIRKMLESPNAMAEFSLTADGNDDPEDNIFNTPDGIVCIYLYAQNKLALFDKATGKKLLGWFKRLTADTAVKNNPYYICGLNDSSSAIYDKNYQKLVDNIYFIDDPPDGMPHGKYIYIVKNMALINYIDFATNNYVIYNLTTNKPILNTDDIDAYHHMLDKLGGVKRNR